MKREEREKREGDGERSEDGVKIDEDKKREGGIFRVRERGGNEERGERKERRRWREVRDGS